MRLFRNSTGETQNNPVVNCCISDSPPTEYILKILLTTKCTIWNDCRLDVWEIIPGKGEKNLVMNWCTAYLQPTEEILEMLLTTKCSVDQTFEKEYPGNAKQSSRKLVHHIFADNGLLSSITSASGCYVAVCYSVLQCVAVCCTQQCAQLNHIGIW